MFGLLTIKEFAKEMKKSESTIRTWRRRGVIPSDVFKDIGDSVYVRINKAQEWLDSGS
jgi:hypothetical protein